MAFSLEKRVDFSREDLHLPLGVNLLCKNIRFEFMTLVAIVYHVLPCQALCSELDALSRLPPPAQPSSDREEGPSKGPACSRAASWARPPLLPRRLSSGS